MIFWNNVVVKWQFYPLQTDTRICVRKCMICLKNWKLERMQKSLNRW